MTDKPGAKASIKKVVVRADLTLEINYQDGSAVTPEYMASYFLSHPEEKTGVKIVNAVVWDAVEVDDRELKKRVRVKKP